MTDDISNALHRAADLLPDRPDRLAEVRRKRTSVVRRRATAAVGVLALVGAGTAYGLTRGGGGGSVVVVPVSTGVELTASGRVVQVPGKPPRFCADVGSTLMLVSPKPPPVWCALGVDVRGVDFTTLEQRYEKAGAVEGYATLTGHLDGDVLVVTAQRPPENQTAPAGFTAAPCPAPPGGWPTTPSGGNPDTTALTDYRNAHPDVVADVAISRPTNTTYGLYVLTYGDPQVVYDALGPTYGDVLCVAHSRWSRAELRSAAEEFNGHADDVHELGVYQWMGSGAFQADGQMTVTASAVRVNADLQAIVARHPAGIIRIDYWLHPVTG